MSWPRLIGFDSLLIRLRCLQFQLANVCPDQECGRANTVVRVLCEQRQAADGTVVIKDNAAAV